MSQVTLAGMSQVSLPTIQNLEADRGNPSIDILEKLGAILGLSFRIDSSVLNWNLLAHFGVPVWSSRSKVSCSDNLAIFFCELRRAIVWSSENPGYEREKEALFATVIAIRDHFGTTYSKYLSDLERDFESLQSFYRLPMTGRIIQLRRQALARLATRL